MKYCGKRAPPFAVLLSTTTLTFRKTFHRCWHCPSEHRVTASPTARTAIFDLVMAVFSRPTSARNPKFSPLVSSLEVRRWTQLMITTLYSRPEEKSGFVLQQLSSAVIALEDYSQPSLSDMHLQLLGQKCLPWLTQHETNLKFQPTAVTCIATK